MKLNRHTTVYVYCDEHANRLEPDGRCVFIDWDRGGVTAWHQPDILDTYAKAVTR